MRRSRAVSRFREHGAIILIITTIAHSIYHNNRKPYRDEQRRTATEKIRKYPRQLQPGNLLCSPSNFINQSEARSRSNSRVANSVVIVMIGLASRLAGA